MIEFKKYIESRERTEAVQLLHADQAYDFATTLRADKWVLHHEGDHFYLEITRGNTVQRIDRGDYLACAPQWPFNKYEVIGYKDFHEAWEEEK